MATVRILWQAGDQLLREEIAQTGKSRRPNRSLTVDLSEVEMEQRHALLALTKFEESTYDDELVLADINISARPEPGSAERLTRGIRATVPLRLDAEPTLDQAISLAQEIAAERATLRKEADRIEAEQEIANAARAQAQTAICALESAGCLAALREFHLPAECSDGSMPARAVEARLQQAIKNLEEEQREASRTAWIAAHGSDHLKRCTVSGYNCQRLYAMERAAAEAPGFTVDFDRSTWQEHPCPTPAALDAADAAQTLGLGKPRVFRKDYTTCEAVVIQGYLGKYTLMRIVE